MMESIRKNLDVIQLHGTAEEIEEVRLVILELAEETGAGFPEDKKHGQLMNASSMEWIVEMSREWTEEQENLLKAFLEQQVQEIISRRERDITLI